MDSRTLGTSGPQVSVVGLGCNNFGGRIDAAAAQAVVGAALDAGITHFDTAESYGGGTSEAILGAALGARRDEVVIATKFTPRPADEPYRPGVLAERIRTACETSLRRLGTDRIDLYYQHFPDSDAPVDEGLVALDELIRAGKVVAIASSNVDAEQIDAAARTASAAGLPAFTATQLEWSLLVRDAETGAIPAARRDGVGIVPYYPLASGMLSGKYVRGEPFPPGSRLAAWERYQGYASAANFDKLEALTAWAAERGHTVLELAIAWLAAQPGVSSVIAGATTPEQVRANAAAGAWRLAASEVAEVAALVSAAS